MDKFIARVRYKRQEKLRKKRNKKILISFCLLFISIIIFGVCFSKVKNLNSSNILANKSNTQLTEASNKTKSLKLSFVGNIICYTSQSKDAFNTDTNTFDYSYLFENVKTHLLESDLTIGTLETNFNVNEKNLYDDFNTPNIFASNLKDIGFDILFTATNHCLDEKEEGLKSTLNVLDNLRNFSYWNCKK